MRITGLNKWIAQTRVSTLVSLSFSAVKRLPTKLNHVIHVDKVTKFPHRIMPTKKLVKDADDVCRQTFKKVLTSLEVMFLQLVGTFLAFLTTETFMCK